MTTHHRSLVLACCAVIASVASGCGKPAETPATPETTSTTTSRATAGPPANPATKIAPAVPSPAAGKGTGKVVGTAVLKVLGTGTATVTWKENGGPAQVEQNVALPWERTIDVIEQANSEVKANGSGASGCTITMDAMLVSYKNEPNPICEFSYWG
ncbi:hypothetical protein FZI91_16525 [Mycobacterium sp. CBMA271]|uniref:hypothetical protein n=1 Tax=unclassified Mycobacteroides TaxID=2618759 RepID=UPI0012DBDC8B|nr:MULTISPECIES: hypothetical protein [unclassified Mycobacteroides]MUM17057.1 hypothetical protein [Mycobacteroides sp. CBMA 326]MUM23295.1 hypothetical protein [Mycobacteroides sp. CBMA 271]